MTCRNARGLRAAVLFAATALTPLALPVFAHAQDVPEAGLFFGLTDASGKKKKAFDVYQDVAAYDSPAPTGSEVTTRFVTPRRTASPARQPTTTATTTDAARATHTATSVTATVPGSPVTPATPSPIVTNLPAP